jgi:uncharacterized protein (DUF488 family)
MSCQNARTIHTIGHSTRTLEAFFELLDAHRIRLLVDVRRWPASRRFPHFAREALEASLQAAGVEYVWRGNLGGFRKPSPQSPNTAWKAGAFRAYADFMLTAAFDEILRDVERLARDVRVALMCAEAVPWRCHRQLLADALVVRNWTVRHILEDRCEEHRLPPFADPAGTKIYYPGPSHGKLVGGA